jgi:hypothetical protein
MTNEEGGKERKRRGEDGIMIGKRRRMTATNIVINMMRRTRRTRYGSLITFVSD